MGRENVPGTTYLLHLDPPYRHARHYLGFAEGDGLAGRLAEHGTPHGAKLLAVVKAAGGTWRIVRTWPQTTRSTERQIKRTRHVPHYCPECQPQRSADRRAARRSQRKETSMTLDPSPDAELASAVADMTSSAWRERGAAQQRGDAAAAAARALAGHLGPDEPGSGSGPEPARESAELPSASRDARSWTGRALRASADRNRNAMRQDIEQDREAGQ
jgi:hypothetical protein